ncbi:MAG: MBL fold metallo-hydrolase [Desulfobacterales bacterium]|jgi:7,8-dihydropterin-6-yl-methyl-4-(beta-D-ribofuranosyl)aminobenzene 5'-phosphate synthase
MPIRLTILCENSVTVPFGVVGEHGFACYLETGDGNYLFDTGQGFGIVQNARVLGKDLAAVRTILLSHGHYDHTGGLPAVLAIRGPVDVVGHPEMFASRVWSDGKVERDIGIPFRRNDLKSLGARFRLVTGWTEVGPGVHLTGEVPRETPFENGDTRMIRIGDDGGRTQPDPLGDDLSLVVETPKGLVLVLGCAHAGMVNIVRHVQRRFPSENIYGIIGGTHLGFSSDRQFDATLDVIEALGIEKIGVSHCTGLANAAILHHRLKERFFFGAVGAVLEI